MARETLPRCICLCPGGRVCPEAFLGTESKGAHPSPFLTPSHPPSCRKGESRRFQTPDRG